MLFAPLNKLRRIIMQVNGMSSVKALCAVDTDDDH